MGDCCRVVGFDDRPIQIGGPPVTDQRASWSGRGHRQLRSGCGRGRRCGRNRPVTATRRWRCRESIVAAVADAVVIPFRPANVCFHPLVPVGPVGVLLAVAHSQTAKTHCPPGQKLFVISGLCGSCGSSALATAAEDTITAAAASIAAQRRRSFNFISTPCQWQRRERQIHSRCDKLHGGETVHEPSWVELSAADSYSRLVD